MDRVPVTKEGYEALKKELENLKKLGKDYPVTLCYLPLSWASDAQTYAKYLFGEPDLETTPYALIYSTQEPKVLKYVFHDLQQVCPQCQLVFCTASVGMGFHGPAISRVIHAKPPNNLIDFVQQIVG